MGQSLVYSNSYSNPVTQAFSVQGSEEVCNKVLRRCMITNSGWYVQIAVSLEPKGILWAALVC